jgi:hypothetical protein
MSSLFWSSNFLHFLPDVFDIEIQEIFFCWEIEVLKGLGLLFFIIIYLGIIVENKSFHLSRILLSLNSLYVWVFLNVYRRHSIFNFDWLICNSFCRLGSLISLRLEWFLFCNLDFQRWLASCSLNLFFLNLFLIVISRCFWSCLHFLFYYGFRSLFRVLF